MGGTTTGRHLRPEAGPSSSVRRRPSCATLSAVADQRPAVAWGYVGSDAQRREQTGVLAVLWVVAAIRYLLVVVALTTLAALVAVFAAGGLASAGQPDGSAPAWWDRALLGALIVGVISGVGITLVAVPMRRRRFEAHVLSRCELHRLEGVHERTVDRLVEGLAIATGCPAPVVLRTPSPALNALAIGATPAEVTVVLTDGVLGLPRPQLEAVLAYELALIASGEVRLTTWIMALTEGSDLSWLRLGLRSWALRTSARHRDRVAASFTRDPAALAAAFAAIATDRTVPEGVTMEVAPMWLEFPPEVDARFDPRAHARIREAMGLERRIAALDPTGGGRGSVG